MKRKTELYRRVIAIICSVFMVVTTMPVNLYGIAYAEETEGSKDQQIVQNEKQGDGQLSENNSQGTGEGQNGGDDQNNAGGDQPAGGDKPADGNDQNAGNDDQQNLAGGSSGEGSSVLQPDDQQKNDNDDKTNSDNKNDNKKSDDTKNKKKGLLLGAEPEPPATPVLAVTLDSASVADSIVSSTLSNGNEFNVRVDKVTKDNIEVDKDGFNYSWTVKKGKEDIQAEDGEVRDSDSYQFVTGDAGVFTIGVTVTDKNDETLTASASLAVKVVHEAEFNLTENYGNFAEIDDKQTDTDGIITLPDTPKARDELYTVTVGNKSYYFTGWLYDDGDDNTEDKEYAPGSNVTMTGSGTFRAVWKQTYSIEFNSTDIDKAPDAITAVFGEPVTLPSATSSVEGLNFAGWTTDGTNDFNAEEEISAENIQPATDTPKLTLTAKLEDKTAPEVDYEILRKLQKKVDGKPVRDGDEYLYDRAVFELTASDIGEGTGIKNIQYIVNDSENVSVDAEGWVTVPDVSTKDGKVTGKVTVQVIEGEGKKTYLHIKATDNNDNPTDPPKSILVDLDDIESQNPIVKIEEMSDDDKKVKKQHTVSYEVTDTSDLASISLYIKKEDSDSFELVKDDLLNSASHSVEEDKNKYKGSVELGDKNQLGEGMLDGDVEIKIEATDIYENEGEDSQTRKFDNTAPEITSFKMTGTMDGGTTGYYGANKDGWTLEIETSEDIQSAEFTIGDETYIGIVDESNASKASTTVSKDVISEKYTEEKEVEITVKVTDIVGYDNSDDNQKLKEITTKEGLLPDTDNKIVVDTVAPALSGAVTPQGNKKDLYNNNYYYDAAVETTYTITERYPDKLDLNYKQDEKPADKISADKETEVTGKWSKDGKYTSIEVSAADKAGNKLVKGEDFDPEDEDSATVSEGTAEFTYGKVIDTKQPEAIVTYTTEATPYFYSNKVYANKKVTAKVQITTVEDDYSVYTVDGKTMGPGKDPVEIKYEDDGEYILKVYGKDHAGHALKITEMQMKDIEKMEGEWPDPNYVVHGEEEEAELQITVVIDTIAPVFTSEYTGVVDDKINVDGKTAYYNDDVTGTFTFTDTNLDPDRMFAGSITGTAKEHNSEVEFKWFEPEPHTKSTKVDDDDTKSQASITVRENGVYRFTVMGTDKAGNLIKQSDAESAKADYTMTEKFSDGKFWSMNKVIDKVAPEAKLVIDDYYELILQGEKKTFNKEIFDPFRKEKKATILTAAKDKSPVSVLYKIRYNGENDNVSSVDDWAHVGEEHGAANVFSNDNQVEYVTSDEIQIQFEVYDISVTDRAGNITSIDSTNRIYLDGTKPGDDPESITEDVIKPEVSVTATDKITNRGPNGQPLYNKDVTLEFAVTDPYKWQSSSGLKVVKYSIFVDNETVIKDKVLKSWDPLETKELQVNAPLTYHFDEKITVKKGGVYESNRIKVVLYAEDNAGRNNTATLLFGIDSVAPKVTVTYDNNSAQNQKYFKADRTATVSVEERNLGSGSDKVKIKTEVSVPKKWSYKKGKAKSGNNDIWTKKLHYNKDGDYTLTITAEDALGNKTKKVVYKGTAPRDFTIDKTAPVIYVTFDNNRARNVKYYNANRHATIRIDEHNFRPADVKVNQKVTGPRNTHMAAPGVSGFTMGGDRHTAGINYVKDGTYSFDVNYTDLAGNPAKIVKVDEFVIDKTKPTVKIENVKNNGIYGDKIEPRAVYDDDNFTRDEIKFSFTGARIEHRGNLVSRFRPNGAYGGAYVMNNFPKIRDNDDIYTAEATITDKAGNTDSVKVRFSVNRFGSTFDYNNDPTTTELVSKKDGRYYTNEPEALKLREININPVTKKTVTLYLNDNSRKLKLGEDYTVSEANTGKGYQYVYSFKDSIITDEGNYNIVVKSKDKAGNTNTNASVRYEKKNREVPLRFVYDVTKPSLVFRDLDLGDSSNNTIVLVPLEDDGFNLFRNDPNSFVDRSRLNLGIVPEDEWAMSSIEIALKDRRDDQYLMEPETYAGEEYWNVMNEEGPKYFDRALESGNSYLYITAHDAAGNEETVKYKIFVSDNPFQIFLHNRPLVIGTIFGILALILIILLVARRKKDKKDAA